MDTVEVTSVCKQFGTVQPVNDVIFTVRQGEIIWAVGSKRGRQDHQHPLIATLCQLPKNHK